MRFPPALSFVLAIGIPGRASAPPEDSAKDLPVVSGMAEVAEPILFYEKTGRGEPVVFIHGGQCDRRIWNDQVREFADRYTVIRYDVRGFGKSEPATRPYSDLKDLLGLLDYLHVRRTHLVGLSLGGRIAIDFTLTRPDRVASLTAVGPGLSGYRWSPEEEKRGEALARIANEAGGEAAAEAWLKDPYMVPAMENPALARRLRVLAHDNARCWLINPMLPRPLRPPAIGRLGEIRTPTLLIVGSRDVLDIQAIIKTLEKGIAGARKVTIEGAGHMVNMEKPAEFNRTLATFLKEQAAQR